MLTSPLLVPVACNFKTTLNEQSFIEVILTDLVRPTMIFEKIYFTKVNCGSCTRGLIHLNLKQFDKV